MLISMNNCQKVQDVILNFNSKFNEVEKVNISFFTVPKLKSTPIDKHKVKELWVVLKGKGKVTKDNKEYLLNINDIFFIESEKEHFIVNTGKQSLSILSIWWES
ncbi:cupin domain-containing protein [Salmonella enterica subsp. enterica serovar Enteritidis]|nr:cupin domain-containing protein [Salmonella enterica subsp. enterica serovar Enteritidis]